MAALFIRNLVFGQQQQRGRTTSPRYTPLRSPTPDTMESGRFSPSTSSNSTSSSIYHEKLAYPSTPPHAPTPTIRINPRLISDATIGLSDGLTVPFALTAGLSALGDTRVVIYGGLAELIAGGISMGLGGYLGGKSEAEGYCAALAETRGVVAYEHARAEGMVRETFAEYDFPEEVLRGLVGGLLVEPERMVEFLMKFHHRLAEADYAPSRAYVSGLTISLGYICGGLVALLPYLFVAGVQDAFFWSVIVMAVALFGFGWAKTALVGESNRWVCFKSGFQMMVLGGVAAGAAMGCVKAIGS